MAPSKTLRRIKTAVGWVSAAYCGYKLTQALLDVTSGEHRQMDKRKGRASPGAEPHAHIYRGTFFKNKDGLFIHWRKWAPPEGKQNGHCVLLVHGYGEHIGRYDHVAAALVARGYTVFGLDHQGHGRSEGDETFMKSLQDLVDDVIQFRKEFVLSCCSTGKKQFLIGHSMGGLIATRAAMQTPDLWDGVVLSGPAFMADPKVATPVNLFLARQVSSLLPKLEIDKIDASKLTRASIVNVQYALDPLVAHEGMKARTAAELLGGMDWVKERMASFTMPFLIQQGTADNLVLPAGAHRFFESAKSSDKTKLMYDGWYHEIFNECSADCGLQTDTQTGVVTNRALRDSIEWIVKRS